MTRRERRHKLEIAVAAKLREVNASALEVSEGIQAGIIDIDDFED